MRWGGGSALRVGGIDRVGPIHGRRGGMARMVVLVVLVILWRFPGFMRVPQRRQVVRLLLRCTRRRIWMLNGRQSYGRTWRRRMSSVVLLRLLRLLLLVMLRLLLLLLRVVRRRMLRLLLLLLLDRRRRRWRMWLRMGCRVVVRLRVVRRWRTMVTGLRLGVRS